MTVINEAEVTIGVQAEIIVKGRWENVQKDQTIDQQQQTMKQMQETITKQAALIDHNTLFICFQTGQMDEALWQDHLRDDPALRAWNDQRLAASAPKE